MKKFGREMKNALKKISYLKKGVNYIQSLFPNYFVYKKEFYKLYNFLQESQWWSEERLREYQWEKLKKLLNHCYLKVPYYQKVFKDLDATPEDFKNFNDFKNFPFLTKEIVRERLDEFIPLGVDKNKLIFFTTGGSTGEPLGFYKTRTGDIIEQAFMFSQWRRVGFKPGGSRVVLRGGDISNNKLWEYRPLTNSWIFSSYRLSKRHISKIVKKLNSINPMFLHVYPSSLWLLTNLIEENSLKISFSPKAILSGSEKLYPFQRKLFEEVFNCRVYNWLGMAEQAILAGECEKSNNLHIISEHSYVELIDKNGNLINGKGTTGEIVGTNFANFMTPFIRYRTGDLASYSDRETCECRRNYRRIENVEGRIQEFVYTKNKENFPFSCLGFHEQWLSKIRRLQFVQNEIGKLIIKIEKKETVQGEILKKELISLYKKRFQNAIDFEIVFTKNMQRTRHGKHKFLIQNIRCQS